MERFQRLGIVSVNFKRRLKGYLWKIGKKLEGMPKSKEKGEYVLSWTFIGSRLSIITVCRMQNKRIGKKSFKKKF